MWLSDSIKISTLPGFMFHYLVYVLVARDASDVNTVTQDACDDTFHYFSGSVCRNILASLVERDDENGTHRHHDRKICHGTGYPCSENIC